MSKKRKFALTYEVTLEIEIDQKVIDRVDDEWRADLYDLSDTKQIVDHLAFNVIANGARLSQLDGWADMEDELLRADTPSWDLIDFDEVDE